MPCCKGGCRGGRANGTDQVSYCVCHTAIAVQEACLAAAGQDSGVIPTDWGLCASALQAIWSVPELIRLAKCMQYEGGRDARVHVAQLFGLSSTPRKKVVVTFVSCQLL